MPKVSVITPCYNSEKYVGQTLQSVCAQSFTDWEQIIVNDGSTDESQGVLEYYAEKDSRIHFIEQSNGGVIQARINGFKNASPQSAYLLFLDADDCPEPDMLKHLVPYLDSHPNVGLVYTEYRFIDEEGSLMHYPDSKHRWVPSALWLRQIPSDYPETPFVSVFTLCPIIPSNSLIRRSVYEKVNGYDESFGQHREDTDLFLRIALNSKIHFFPEKLVLRRRHPGQDTADSPQFRQKANAQTQKLYAKWRKGEGLTQGEKKLVRSAWRFKQGKVEPYEAFLRAYEYLRAGNILKALRFYMGGIKYYLISFIPWIKI